MGNAFKTPGSSVGDRWSGKAKDMRIVAVLEQAFSDRLTVFDVKEPNRIPYKGATLALTSEYMFGVARDLGLDTHFLARTGPNRILVRLMDVDPSYTEIDQPNRIIPLEFIVRNYVEGSLWRAVQDGTVTAEQLGFEAGRELKRGDRLAGPKFEMWTKREKVDRLLEYDEALRIGGVSDETVGRIMEILFKLNKGIQERVSENSKVKAGDGFSSLIRVDGKAELALDEHRMPLLVDSFGNADEDRWWEWSGYKENKLEDFSKEFVRRYYMDTGFYGDLMKVRRENDERKKTDAPLLEEPRIPMLPAWMVRQTSELYISIFERLTGKTFVPEYYEGLSLEKGG